MTTAGVKTCRIPGAILYHPDLSLPEKMLLGLVWSFPDGLRLSNAEIGKIVCLYPDNVSRIISKLESTGRVRITGKQSRWRKIYFVGRDKVEPAYSVADNKVKQDDTLSFEADTLSLATTYSVAGDKQNKKNKREEKKISDFSFSDVETPPDGNPTSGTQDPEKIKRVLESLAL